jgi:LPS-assembly lipoprotein
MALTNILSIRFQRSLIPLLLLLVIQACGFQLRGALEISPDLSPLYLQKNTLFSLGRDIKQLLVSNKVEVTDDAETANSKLTLIDEKKESRVLSVDTNGRVREYLLIYTVDYSIQFKDASGERLEAEPTMMQATMPTTMQPTIQSTVEPTKQSGHQQSTAIFESISVKRTLLFNEDAVLAVTNESEVLYKDMRRDVARLILLKVQARAKEAEAANN